MYVCTLYRGCVRRERVHHPLEEKRQGFIPWLAAADEVQYPYPSRVRDADVSTLYCNLRFGRGGNNLN